MNKLIILAGLVAIFALCGNGHASRVRYENYRLLHVTIENKQQAELLLKLEDNEDFDVWNSARSVKKLAHVLLSPAAFLKYKAVFEANNMSYVVVDENIQSKIDEQIISDHIARSKRSTKADITKIFASYAEIMQFMDSLAQNNEFISVENIGSSVENRNLNVLKFNTGNTKRKVWLDCGIHARERIAISTCVYLIDYFTKGYNSNDPDVVELLDYYEFTVMPLLNPDGYEFARTDTPLWRKNRRVNEGSTCKGVNLNGNWGYNWMVGPGGGSDNPCSDRFPGIKADSEPETTSIQQYLLKDNDKYDAYLTIHTYGLWWFTPWGYTYDLPSDYEEILEKIQIGANAVKASLNGTGSEMEIGSSANILYLAAGGSEDWAKGVAGIKHATCLELRPGQSGVDSFYGFLLPASRIPLVGEETTNGIIAYLKAIKADSETTL